jgi:hypothetical protein
MPKKNCPLRYSACGNITELREGNSHGDFLCEEEACTWWNSAEGKCSLALLGEAAFIRLIEYDEKIHL